MNLPTADKRGAHERSSARHWITRAGDRNRQTSRVQINTQHLIGMRWGREVARESNIAPAIDHRCKSLPENAAARCRVARMSDRRDLPGARLFDVHACESGHEYRLGRVAFDAAFL